MKAVDLFFFALTIPFFIFIWCSIVAVSPSDITGTELRRIIVSGRIISAGAEENAISNFSHSFTKRDRSDVCWIMYKFYPILRFNGYGIVTGVARNRSALNGYGMLGDISKGLHDSILLFSPYSIALYLIMAIIGVYKISKNIIRIWRNKSSLER